MFYNQNSIEYNEVVLSNTLNRGGTLGSLRFKFQNHPQSMNRVIDELNIAIPDNNMLMGTEASRLSLDSGLGSSSSTGSLQLQACSAPHGFEPPLRQTNNNFVINEPTNSSFQLKTHSVPPGFKPLPGHNNNNFVTNKQTNEGIHIVCTKSLTYPWLCKSEITEGQCPLKKILKRYPNVVTLNSNIINPRFSSDYRIFSACTGMYIAHCGDNKRVTNTERLNGGGIEMDLNVGHVPVTDYKNTCFDEWLSGGGQEMNLNFGHVPVTDYRNTCFDVYTQMVVSDNAEERHNGAVIHSFLKKVLISELEWFQQNEDYIMETAKPPTRVHVINDDSFKLLVHKGKRLYER